MLAIAAGGQQKYISINTDVGLFRNFQPQQQFTTVGNTVILNLHFNPKQSFYIWYSNMLNGKFSNQFLATAKSPIVYPQEIAVTNNAKLKFKQLSIGFKKYLVGDCAIENGWSLYSFAGFGLQMGQISNTQSVPVDTAAYMVPVQNGSAHYKRLTLDLGIGAEVPIGGDLYFYTEARTAVPASDYPSPYFLNNKNAPFTGSMHAGIRILF